MLIKITSCSVPGIWYENKIGREFEANYIDGWFYIINNPLFKIKPSDCISSHNPVKKGKISDNILMILSNNELTTGSIHKYYCEEIGRIGYSSVLKSVTTLRKLGLIKETGLRVRTGMIKISNVWAKV